ncbi:MAG TPA: response regulator [Gemmata sp.]
MPFDRSSLPAPPPTKNSTVCVLDDDPDVCRSLSWLLTSVGLQVHQFASVSAYLGAEQGRPGCVVADVRLPDSSGLALLERIRAGERPVPVILITGHAAVPLAVRAMRVGAFDFFEKPVDHQRLLDRVQEAIRFDQTNLAGWADREAARALVGKLSGREREVFSLLVRGLANKQVATRLGLSIKTVEAHRAHICEKLERDHLGDLIALASVAGIDCSGLP